ncbi:hypothetical protein KVV02_005388 [Mortierella alpina]|uniref:Uncharacterized protein n=1 Tax=Mortierella alpina TaxID=64518 RepID=A0A9P8CYE3_MORAP|nr:hypothetical protein KVV02_005388 [Mortierella alpina]
MVFHQGGYCLEELATFKLIIYRSLVDSAKCLILAMEKMGLEPSKPENRGYADNILNYRVIADPYLKLSPSIVDALDSLYCDPITVTCMERLRKFGIEDVAPYFLSQVRRLGADDYTPSKQDILRSKSKNTGISEIRLRMGQLNIR